MKPDRTLGFQDVNRFLNGLFDGDLHVKRVLSLANATLGVVPREPRDDHNRHQLRNQ